MLRHSRFSCAVPRAQLQTAAGLLFGPDPSPTPLLQPLRVRVVGRSCLKGMPAGRSLAVAHSDPGKSAHRGMPGALEKTARERPKGHSAPQPPSRQLRVYEAPALPRGSVIPSSCRMAATEARLATRAVPMQQSQERRGG